MIVRRAARVARLANQFSWANQRQCAVFAPVAGFSNSNSNSVSVSGDSSNANNSLSNNQSNSQKAQSKAGQLNLAAYIPDLKPSAAPKPVLGVKPVYHENTKLALDPAITPGPLAINSDVPDYVVQRGKVTVYQPANFLGQSNDREGRWEINFTQRGNTLLGEVWKEPLMGWTSSRDPMRGVTDHLTFPTKEAAIDYCEKMGYDYEVAKAHKRKHLVRVYADKFKSTKYLRDKKSPNPDEE